VVPPWSLDPKPSLERALSVLSGLAYKNVSALKKHVATITKKSGSRVAYQNECSLFGPLALQYDVIGQPKKDDRIEFYPTFLQYMARSGLENEKSAAIVHAQNAQTLCILRVTEPLRIPACQVVVRVVVPANSSGRSCRPHPGCIRRWVPWIIQSLGCISSAPKEPMVDS